MPFGSRAFSLCLGLALLLGGCAVESTAGFPVLSARAQSARYAAVQHALEHDPSGSGIAWSEVGGPASGIVIPLGTERSSRYGWCRDYEERIFAGGTIHPLVGIACREPGRRWLVLDIRPVAAG